MSKRAVFNVATGRYVLGQKRLEAGIQQFGCGAKFIAWADDVPPGSPSHQKNPYAFKAYALQHALTRHSRPTTLLWADASILPIRSLEPLWERIERDGYWISNNGWANSQWTCDAAYPMLFPEARESGDWSSCREVNLKIPHVVATTFGISLDHKIGREFLAEYVRLAEAGAFRGPWWNSNGARKDYAAHAGAEPCGPPECLGHRHDQTCASVIAWRLGMKLTNAPEVFAYRGGETEQTILVADGGY